MPPDMVDYTAWIGRTEEVSDPLSLTQVRLAAATFDDTSVWQIGDPLPLLWNWFYFLPTAPQSRLGLEGHPLRGDFMPPIPFPRRMFAGARLRMHQPLIIGEAAHRVGTIRNVTVKTGRSGELAFVTVNYRFYQRDVLCLEEEQDIVYRQPGTPISAPVPTALPPLPTNVWDKTIIPDSRLLFRFSALTFNAHRIHYDHAYVTGVEGYPGIIVHGQLIAVLLLQLVRSRTAQPVIHFSFRGQSPLFVDAPVRLVAQPTAERVMLSAQAIDASEALVAEAELGKA